MKKLTTKQQDQLNQLNEYGPLFVGYNSRPIMNTFDKLVEKGYAKEVRHDSYGKTYTAKNA